MVVLLLGWGSWYFLIRDYQYSIQYKSRFPSGVYYDHLQQWTTVLPDNVDSVTTLIKVPYVGMLQKVQVGDQETRINWEIESLTDSTCRIYARFDRPGNDLSHRLSVLFGQSDLPDQGLAITKHVGNTLVAKAKGFRLGAIGDTIIPKKFAAYITVQSSVRTKARDMIYSIGDIMGYIKENDIQLDGDPFLQITSWDRNTDRITFDFNFPIVKRDNLPDNPLVRFKEIPEFEALNAPFFGNYRIADISWYQLLAYAQLNNISIQELPIEIYRNDPHLGGDERNWRADVLIPRQ
ncbi:hypothetical protein BST85_02665 [Aureitalea marina]|uniref:GyrI-like small molecule binding domain-containing protein n=1 Tax=Aureitalea marina TaxID=930804 RepID=A0A2S7KMW3_9FLAO|nr:hypothetical protein BST85_02665 [Aureitalea marina]